MSLGTRVSVIGCPGCGRICKTVSVVSTTLENGGSTTNFVVLFTKSRKLRSVLLNGVEVDASVNPIGRVSNTFVINPNEKILVGSVTVSVLVSDPRSPNPKCNQTFPFTLSGSGVVPQPPT